MIIDLAEQLLEIEDGRLYQAAVTAKYSNAAPDYEQLLHVGYANHTLVVPAPVWATSTSQCSSTSPT